MWERGAVGGAVRRGKALFGGLEESLAWGVSKREERGRQRSERSGSRERVGVSTRPLAL